MTALLIILVIFVFLLLAPREIYPCLIAGVVPVYVWLWWLIARPVPISNDWGDFDRAIIGSAMIVGVIPAIARFLISYVQEVSVSRLDLNWRPAHLSCLVVTIWGGSWLFSPYISKLFGVGLTVTLGSIAAAVATGLAICTRRRRMQSATAAFAIIGGIAAVLWWPFAIIQAAERQAGNQPYCLLVANGADYRAASNMLDLTPLVMRGKESERSAYNYHGQMLLAGDSPRNWSYLKRDFLENARDSHPPTCRPKSEFSRQLPWF